ncbi:MAG: DM13 domain-containing protein [Cyanobacteria bacterium SBLK]|nr:DM13 domain-containing protein [Cyanobacteria bacterium SBLK]
MKFNTFSALAIASTLLIGTAGEMTFNPTPVQAETSQQIAQNSTGRFVTVKQEKSTTGTARIVREGDKTYLEFDGAFSTANGPDVNVLLHHNNTVDVNLDEGDYFTLAALQSQTGAQRYELPGYLNVSDYNSVVIWCRKFNVSFGYATL